MTMYLEAKIRKIWTSYGIIIPRDKLEEIGAREGDLIAIRRIERPAKDIRGILKGSAFTFER